MRALTDMRFRRGRWRELRGGGGRFFLPLAPTGRAGFALGRPLLLLGLPVLVRGRLDAVDQLEEYHRRAVAGPVPGLDDARVAAVPVGEPRGDRVELPTHDFRVGNHRK